MPDYGIHVEDTTELALLPCGASLRRFDDDHAVVRFRHGPLGQQGEPLRQGDAALFCREGCVVFERCPLVKSFVEVYAVEVERELIRHILLNDLKRRHRHWNLANVRDSQGSAPAGLPFNRLRFLGEYRNGELHVVIPPMAEVVNEGGVMSSYNLIYSKVEADATLSPCRRTQVVPCAFCVRGGNGERSCSIGFKEVRFNQFKGCFAGKMLEKDPTSK